VENEWYQWSPRVFEVKQRAGSPRSQGINISHRGTEPQRNNIDIKCRASVYRAMFFSDHQISNVWVENEWYQRSPRIFEVTVRAGSPRSQGLYISHRGTKPQRNNIDIKCRASVYRARFFSDHQIINVGATRECGKRFMELSISRTARNVSLKECEAAGGQPALPGDS
jgi:hypothetical protein